MSKRLRSTNNVSDENNDYRRGFAEGEEIGYNNAVQSFSNNTKKKNTDGAELEEVLNKNVQLREENQKLNEAQISLQTEFIKRTSNFDSTIATLNSQLETYRVDIDKLQNQLETYRVDINTRNARSSKSDEELKEIKKLALKNKVEWQGQLQKKETENATLKNLNDVIAQEKNELTENSKTTIIELQEQVSTKTNEILNLTTNNDNLRKKLQTLEAENTRLDKLQASHAAQLQELQASYDKQLTDTIEHYDSEKQSDSQKISQLEADLTKKKQQLDQQQNELGQFNIQFTQLQTSNAEQVRAAAENERLQRELQNQIQSQLQQLQTSQAAQAQAATENEKQFTKLQQDAAENEGRLLQEYNKKIADITQTYNNNYSKLEAYLTEKNKQLDQKQSDLNNLNNLNTQLQQLNTDYKEQFQKLQYINAEQVQQLKKSAAENERLQQELQAAAEKENQLIQLQQLQPGYKAQLQQLQDINAAQLQQLQTSQVAQAQAAAENKDLLQRLQASKVAQAQAAAEKEELLLQEYERKIYDINQIYDNQIQSANQQISQLKTDNDKQILIIKENNLQILNNHQEYQQQSYNQQEKIIEITNNIDQLFNINNALMQDIYTLKNQLNQNKEICDQLLVRQQQQNKEEYDQLLELQQVQHQQLEKVEFSNSILITQLNASEKKVAKIEEASEAALTKSKEDLESAEALLAKNKTASEAALAKSQMELAEGKSALTASETELANNRTAGKTALAETKEAGEAALAEIKAALAKAETELVINNAASEKAMASIKAALAASESKAIEAERKVESIEAALDKNKTALTESNAKTKEIELELAESKRNAALNLNKVNDLERINVVVNTEKGAQSDEIEKLKEELKNEKLKNDFFEEEDTHKNKELLKLVTNCENKKNECLDEKQKLQETAQDNVKNLNSITTKAENLLNEVKTCELEKRKCLDERQKLQQTAQDNVNNLNSITAEAENFLKQANEAKRDAELNSKVAEIYIRNAEETLQKAKDKASKILKLADDARDETIKSATDKATAIVTEATDAANTKITEAAKTANQLLEESKNEAQIITNSIEDLIAKSQKEIKDAENILQKKISEAENKLQQEKLLSQKEIKEAEEFSENVLKKKASEILDNARIEAQSIIDVNKDLKEENEKLSQNNSSIGETLTALTTKKNELDAILAAIKIEVEQYEKEKSNIKDLSNNIRNLTFRDERLVEETNTKQKFLQDVTQKFNSKITEYNSLKSEIKKSNKKLEEINTNVYFLTSSLSSKKSDLDSIEKKIKAKEKIENEFKDFTQDLIATNNFLIESKQKLNDFENSEQFKNYNTNLLEVTELKKTNESLNENYNDLNEKLNDKIEEIKNLDSGKKILEASIKENEQSLSTVKDTLEKTQSELDNIKKDLIDASNLNESLSKENNELREKIDARNLGAAQAIEEMQKSAANENSIILNDFETKKQNAEKDLKTLNDIKISITGEIEKANVEIAANAEAAKLKIADNVEEANVEIAAKKEEAKNEIEKLKIEFAKAQEVLESEKSELQIKKNSIDAVISKQKEFEDKIKSLQTEIESETKNEKQLKESITFLKEKKKKYDQAKYLEENEFALDFRTKIATFPLQVIQLTEENRKYQDDNIILTKKLQKLLQIKEFVELFDTENNIQNFSANLNNLKSDFDLFSKENPDVVRLPGEYSNDIESYLNNISLNSILQTDEQQIYYIILQLQKKYIEFQDFIESLYTNKKYNQVDLNIILEKFTRTNNDLINLQLDIKDALLNVIITSSGKKIGDDIIGLLKNNELTFRDVNNCLLKKIKIEDNVNTLYKTIFGNDGNYNNPNDDGNFLTKNYKVGNPANDKEITLNNINTFFKTLFLEININPIFENVKKSKKKLTLNALITNYKELVEFKKNIDQATEALKIEHDEALKALKEENEKKIIEDKQRITELTNENEKLITENTQINNFYDNNYEKIEIELGKLRSTTNTSILNLITNLIPQFLTDKSKYVEEIPGILKKVNKIIETYNEKIVALDTENNQNKETIITYKQKNTELVGIIDKYNEVVKKNYSNIESNLKEIPQYLLKNDTDLFNSVKNLFVDTPTIESLATNVRQDTFIDIISKIMPLITETLQKNKENIEENDAKIKKTQIENEKSIELFKINVNNLSENNKALSTQNQKYLTAIVENARLIFDENKKINQNNTNNVIDDTKLSNENAVDYLKKIAELLKNSLTRLIEENKELQTNYEQALIAEENEKSKGERINNDMATFTISKKKEEEKKTEKIYKLVSELIILNAIHGGDPQEINKYLFIYSETKDLDRLIQILEFLKKNTVLYQQELLKKLKIASESIDSENYTRLYDQLKIKKKEFESGIDWLESGGSEIDKNLMIIKQKIHDYEGFIEEICMIRENANIYGDVGNLAITNNTEFQDFLNYLIGNIKNWLNKKIDYQIKKEKFLEKENKKKEEILKYLINQYSITQSLKKIVETSGLTDYEKKKYNDEYIKYIPESNYEILQEELSKKISKTNSWKTKDETELKNKTEETLKLKTKLLQKEEKETELTGIITKKEEKNNKLQIIISEKDSIITQKNIEINTLQTKIKINVTPQDYNELSAQINLKTAEIQANENMKIEEKKEMQEKYQRLEAENYNLKENIKSNEQNVIECRKTIEEIRETLNMKIKENRELQLKLTNAGSGGTPVGNPVAPGSYGTPAGTGSYGTQIQEIEKILQTQQQQYADTSNEIQFSIRNFQELLYEKEYEAEQQKRRESIKILKGSSLKKITESIAKPKKDTKQETRNLSKALAMLGKATSELSDSNRKTKEALTKRKTVTSMR